MDLKFRGKSWAGDIYHKFEAMCHEVDDFVSQDTVKYVGNQVQTVGESVKKFYSDVVQDLLPSPLVEPVQCKGKEVSQNENNSVVFYASSMIGIEQKCEDMKPASEKHNSEDVLENSWMSSFAGLRISGQMLAAPTVDTAGEADSKISFGKEDDALPTKNSVVSFGIHVDEEEQSPLGSRNNRSYEDSSEASADGKYIVETHKNGILSNESFDSLAIGPGLKSLESEGIMQENLLDKIDCDSNISSVLHSTELASSIVSCENHSAERLLASTNSNPPEETCHSLDFSSASLLPKAENMCHNPINRSTSFSDLSGVLMSSEPLPVEACNKDVDITFSYSSCGILSESNDISRVDEPISDPGSSESGFEELSEHNQLETFTTSLETGCAFDFTDIADPSLETIDLSDKEKLDESCVIVDSRLLCAVSSRVRKHRSYKKLIQEAFTSRKRLTKEYELLAILYGDIDEECRQPLEQNLSFSVPTTSDSKKLLSRELSEWEIL